MSEALDALGHCLKRLFFVQLFQAVGSGTAIYFSIFVCEIYLFYLGSQKLNFEDRPMITSLQFTALAKLDDTEDPDPLHGTMYILRPCGLSDLNEFECKKRSV